MLTQVYSPVSSLNARSVETRAWRLKTERLMLGDWCCLEAFEADFLLTLLSLCTRSVTTGLAANLIELDSSMGMSLYMTFDFNKAVHGYPQLEFTDKQDAGVVVVRGSSAGSACLPNSCELARSRWSRLESPFGWDFMLPLWLGFRLH